MPGTTSGTCFVPAAKRATILRATVAWWWEYMGFRFLLLICYDLRFPVWSRNRGDYDAILCSASWADDRREVWRTLLRARAIENQCYLAGVNRVGTDPDAFYAGDSALVDFRGATLADAGEREQTSSPNSTPMRRRPSARSSRRGWMPTASS
ncbi:MAG: nitrilase-related carbon-nitrogen hydrolase [Alistipes onderdonkii]